MTLGLERRYPAYVAVVASAATAHLTSTDKISVVKELASPVISILAIQVGFVAAALTILLTAQGLHILRRLKKAKSFRLLVDYHWSAILAGFFSAVLTLCAAVCCKSTDGCRVLLFHLWVFSVVMALMAFLRVVSLLRAMLLAEAE